MTTKRRITFGDDGSHGADTAWGWINAQAWPDWTVDVVRVTDPKPGIESVFTHEPLHEIDPDDPRVADPSSGLAQVHHLTTAYDPRVILCEKHDADLLVIGARGRGILKAMHVGSTAEWLMRCPSTPLVIARSDQPVRSVVVCVDGSGHADAAVDVLADMPWLPGCRVQILTAVEGEEVVGAAAEVAAERLSTAGATVTVHLLEPDPLSIVVNTRYLILDAIEQLAPDLVVLGTQGRTGMSRLMVGSVAGAVAHRANCSVLLAREPGV